MRLTFLPIYPFVVVLIPCFESNCSLSECIFTFMTESYILYCILWTCHLSSNSRMKGGRFSSMNQLKNVLTSLPCATASNRFTRRWREYLSIWVFDDIHTDYTLHIHKEIERRKNRSRDQILSRITAQDIIWKLLTLYLSFLPFNFLFLFLFWFLTVRFFPFYLFFLLLLLIVKVAISPPFMAYMESFSTQISIHDPHEWLFPMRATSHFIFFSSPADSVNFYSWIPLCFYTWYFPLKPSMGTCRASVWRMYLVSWRILWVAVFSLLLFFLSSTQWPVYIKPDHNICRPICLSFPPLSLSLILSSILTSFVVTSTAFRRSIYAKEYLQLCQLF